MKLLNPASLERGATVIDFVFPNNATSYGVPDLIGIVSAYLGRGLYPKEMEKELAERLNPRLARQARETFKYFDRYDATGLWTEGAAYDDISFTNKTLDKLYPNVNQAHRLLMNRY